MKINFVLFIFCFAFLSGCSLQPTSTIEVSSDGTATISRVHRDIIDGAPIRHSEVLDGNVKFNGQEIARPEGSTLKIREEGSTIFIYVDDKLEQEVRIDE